MSRDSPSVVLVHGAWADGSSWAKVIGPLAAEGVRVLAAPLPLTSFAEDRAAVARALERVSGPVVLAGSYAGAVIAATRDSGRRLGAPLCTKMIEIAGGGGKADQPCATTSEDWRSPGGRHLCGGFNPAHETDPRRV